MHSLRSNWIQVFGMTVGVLWIALQIPQLYLIVNPGAIYEVFYSAQVLFMPPGSLPYESLRGLVVLRFVLLVIPGIALMVLAFRSSQRREQ